MALMSLGDFFKSAPYCKPVNPRPVRFKMFATGTILPGGARNPSPDQFVGASAEAALVFLPPRDLPEVREVARKVAQERHSVRYRQDCEAAERSGIEAPAPQPLDAGDVNMQFSYEYLSRVIRQWDDDAKMVGPQLFNDGEHMRSHVMLSEANRLMDLYDEYVKAEHAEVVTPSNFRKPDGGGQAVAPRAPGRPVAPPSQR